VRYLDYLGNNDGSFDIGDFLAWVKATGAPLSAAALQARQRKGGPRMKRLFSAALLAGVMAVGLRCGVTTDGVGPGELKSG